VLWIPLGLVQRGGFIDGSRGVPNLARSTRDSLTVRKFRWSPPDKLSYKVARLVWESGGGPALLAINSASSAPGRSTKIWYGRRSIGATRFPRRGLPPASACLPFGQPIVNRCLCSPDLDDTLTSIKGGLAGGWGLKSHEEVPPVENWSSGKSIVREVLGFLLTTAYAGVYCTWKCVFHITGCVTTTGYTYTVPVPLS